MQGLFGGLPQQHPEVSFRVGKVAPPIRTRFNQAFLSRLHPNLRGYVTNYLKEAQPPRQELPLANP